MDFLKKCLFFCHISALQFVINSEGGKKPRQSRNLWGVVKTIKKFICLDSYPSEKGKHYEKNSIQKITAAMLAAAMTVTSVSASAEGVKINSEEYIEEYGVESEITAASKNKFYDYLTSLTKDEAALILADEELSRYMQREAYWKADFMTEKATSVRAVSLPISEYPVGSYFSYNGKACTCHSYCTYDVPSGYSSTRCYKENTSSSGNCRRYNGGIQCGGFAYYVFYKCTGTQCSSSNDVAGLSVLNEQSLRFFFSNMTIGSHVRGILSSGYPHSIIITGITDTGISYYQANVGGACKVSTDTKTWSQLSEWFDSFSMAWIA